MNESEKMTDLILEAYQKCKDQGHRMDWQRFNNYHAQAECLDCSGHVIIEKGNRICYSNLTENKCKGR